MDILIQHGADVNEYGSDYLTAFHAACTYGHVKCIDALLALGADVEGTINPWDSTPLQLAVSYDHNDCVTALVERHGADLNANGIGGNTALHMAVASGFDDIIQTLVT